MALTFPSSPTNGQIFTDTATGYRYIYNATAGVWAFSSASTNHIHINWNTATGRTAFRPHVVYTNVTNTYLYGTGCEL